MRCSDTESDGQRAVALVHGFQLRARLGINSENIMPVLLTALTAASVTGVRDVTVKDPFYVNYLDDLVAVTHGGITLKVDFGGNDTITGSIRNDDITTHNGNDIAYGGLGNDVFHDLGLGNDQFFGGDGADSFFLGAGNDTADGGAGTDTVNYTGIAFSVVADLANGFGLADGIDRYSSIENMYGSSWSDTIKGNASANRLVGGGGDDKLMGRTGADFLLGGTGNDVLMGNDGTNAAETTPAVGLDDRLYGEAGNDRLFGDAGNDFLSGGNDDDILSGGLGNDMLLGGLGNDVLTGGAGADTFIFQAMSEMPKADRITDFQQGLDKIDLSAIDANPFVAGDQSFSFPSIIRNDLTATGVSVHPGPVINGHTAHVEFRIRDNLTYVYVETGDHITGAHIVLNGAFQLHQSDFVL